MQAYADGKTIQFRLDVDRPFSDEHSPNFSFPVHCYRIKPESVLRPWTEAEIEAECRKGTVLEITEAACRVIGLITAEGSSIYVGHFLIAKSIGDAARVLHDKYIVSETKRRCGVME